MAANGARKASPPGPTPNSDAAGGAVKKVNGERKKMVLKLKKAAPHTSIPGNWKESEVVGANKSGAKDRDKEKDAQAATDEKEKPPAVNEVDDKVQNVFAAGRPLLDKGDVVQCKHCRRPLQRSVAAAHIRTCLNKKQEKLKKKKEAKEAKDAALRREKGEDDDGPRSKSAGKGAVVDGEGAKKGKKRKAEGDADKAPNAKKKKKDEVKNKAKPKGPVDVERQCGVRLPNGGFCARSLTCKSHSMGLKRAVGGRSLPYDMLLAQYQKKNQAKQQRAAIHDSAPLPEDIEPAGPVDSEDEKEQIMAALARHRPRPMATFTPISQRRKYSKIRLNSQLRSAFGSPNGGSIFGNTPVAENMGTSRNIAMGMMGAPNSATNETFPNSANSMGGFSQPMSAGLDGSSSNGNMNGGAGRRQSSISMGNTPSTGPRQILPGQLPGPTPQQRKGSMASVVSTGGS